MPGIIKNRNLTPADIKRMNTKQLNRLCNEIRELLIDVISENGGHLASNLGVVELTVALHRVFDCPKDQIVWDVGHQSYVHKILTDRLDKFDTLRKEKGLSGFSRPSESKYDAFISGHAGVSVSAAYGLAVAKTLNHEEGCVISVTGDGAFSNGEIYEAINNAGRSRERLIVVLNDNGMSISKNEGALANILTNIRTSNGYFKTKDFISDTITKIPVVGNGMKNAVSSVKTLVKSTIYGSNIFEDFGFTYLGPVDGHDMETLCDVFERAKELKRPVIVHVNTKKGVGYEFAQNNPTKYHGVSKFNKQQGVSSSVDNFSSVFGKTLIDLAEKNSKICAVTAAMCDGTGLCSFAEKYKSAGRFFDVGIAEGHGMTFAAALATNGIIPVYAIYSTFLQRAYDQMIHDIAIENLHVILGIDRAGVVGDDGETHQGVFDVAMLKSLPEATVFSPANYEDLRISMEKAINGRGICAVRYPRGKESPLAGNYHTENLIGDFVDGEYRDILVITYGRLWGEVLKADEILKEKGVKIAKLKLTRILPVEESLIEKIMPYKNIFFYEEGAERGGLCETYGAILAAKGYRGNYRYRGIANFVPQATVEKSIEKLKLDSLSIVSDICSLGLA